MSAMMKTVKTVGAASVLVGGLFHLGGPAIFRIPLVGGALNSVWNFGIGFTYHPKTIRTCCCSLRSPCTRL